MKQRGRLKTNAIECDDLKYRRTIFMKRMYQLIATAAACVMPLVSYAGWHTVTITNIYMVTDASYATSDLPGIRVMIIGTFTPALPCANQIFTLVPTDQLFKETYSMFVAAKLSGTPIQYYHIYCTATTGIGRGNLYQLGGP